MSLRTTPRFFAVAAALAFAGPASAQTWTGAGATDLWSDAANWSAPPVSGATTSLVFAGSRRLAPVNDLAGFVLNQLTFDATARAFTLSGNDLTFSGAGATLSHHSVLVQTIQNNLTLASALTVNVSDGSGLGSDRQLFLNGDISGAGGLTKTGNGVLWLRGNNSYGGGTTLSRGTVVVDGDSGLGAAGTSITFNPGGGGQSNLFVASSGAVSSNRPISVGSGTGRIFNRGTLTLSGDLSGGGTFRKEGGGRLELTAANSLTGALSVRAGEVALTGVGSLVSASSLTVVSGGTLTLDFTASAAAKTGAAAPVTIGGGNGELKILGNAGSAVALTSGALALGGAGLGVVTLAAAGTGGVDYLAASLAAPAAGRLLFVRGDSLGGAPGAGVGSLRFTASPAAQLVGLDGGILPFAGVATAASAAGPTTFGTYDTVNGRVAGFTAYAADNLNAGAGKTVDATTALSASGQSINALRLSAGGGVSLASSLTLGANALLALPGNTGIAGGTLSFTLPTFAANLFITGDLALSSALSVTSGQGLMMAGPGTLTFSPTAAFGQTIRVASGTFRIGADNVTSGAANVVLNPGATFDLNGHATTIGQLSMGNNVQTLANNPTPTLAMGGGTLTIQDNGSSSVPREFTGNITGGGKIVKDGTGFVTFYGTADTASGAPDFTGDVVIRNGILGLGTYLDTGGTPFGNAAQIRIGDGLSATAAVLQFNNLLDGFDRPLVADAGPGGSAALKAQPGGWIGAAYSSPITLVSDLSVALGAPGQSVGGVLSGSISGGGALRVDGNLKGDDVTAVTTLTGSNSYTGGTLVSRQTLQIGATSALPVNGSVQVDASGRLSIGATTPTVGALTGLGQVVIEGGTLSVGGGGASSAFDGSIAGTGVLSKISGGNFVLSGGSPFLGAVEVQAGTLTVDGTLSGASGVAVQAGATLAGVGAISAIDLNDGAILSPGDSIGTLAADSMVWDGGGLMRWELGPGLASDRLQLNAALQRGSDGLFFFDFQSVGTPDPGSYLLAEFGSSSGFSQSDFSAPTIYLGNFVLTTTQLHYNLVAILPEPGTLALAGLGLGCGALARLRRRR